MPSCANCIPQKHKAEEIAPASTQFRPSSFPDDPYSNNSGYYDLVSVLTHKGRSNDSGHYVSWRKLNEKQWLKFDDEKVALKTADDILKLSGGGDLDCAYILIYAPRPLPIIPIPTTDVPTSMESL